MTQLDTRTALVLLVEEFDRLRLRVADRLDTAEDAGFLGLICALEEVIERLSPPMDSADTLAARVWQRQAPSTRWLVVQDGEGDGAERRHNDGCP